MRMRTPSNNDCVIWKLIITSRYLGCMGLLPCPVSFDALEDPDTKISRRFNVPKFWLPPQSPYLSGLGQHPPQPEVQQ